MSNVPYRMSATSITLMLNNTPQIIPSSHMNFGKLVEELKKPQHDSKRIATLADIPAAIKLASSGRVDVFDGEVHVDGTVCHNHLAVRILESIKNGFPIEPLMRFLDRLYSNPNTEIREDLFKWLESGDMPITEDGCFIGYKYVQSDYYSSHSGKDGKVLHALFTTVSMPREECDESRDNTCSTGLHFCSYEYLPSGYTHSQRIIILKIAPENVTAIPNDYRNQKGRCCEYDVIGEITGNVSDHYRGRGVVDPAGTLEDVNIVPEGQKSAKPVGERTKDEIKEILTGLSFKHAATKKTFTAFRVWNEVNKKGQRKASTNLGVPRTTIQNWLTVINEAL